MRVLPTLVSLAFVAGTLGSSWFSKAAYNKWHETELERWLSDHDIPYPTPADRRDLEKLVESSWNDYVVTPYQSWDAETLSNYLKLKGVETQESAQASKGSLISLVQKNWYETEEKAQQGWSNIRDWILDTWTDSQLKAFCDRHAIPVPQPRKRDTFLTKARGAYDTASQKIGEAASYPGNWLYETWTESDLKEWLDTNGFPAPQPSTRDKLIASVRRNSRLAYLRAQDQLASATASAQAAYATLTDKLIDAWGESDLKDFCDRNGINVPQGTKVNEIRALVRKHRAELLGDTLSGTVASAYGAATSKAGNEYARATDATSDAAQQAFDAAVSTWSASRLKAYLDARGIPIPQASKTDELRALVRKHSHQAAATWNSINFEDYSVENLKNYLVANGDAAAKKVGEKTDATRAELVKAAQSAYTSASKAGGATYASAASYLASTTQSAKDSVFDTWSESELKAYLDSYGIPVPQGSKLNELRAYARKHLTYFRYGTSNPTDTIFAKIGEGFRDTWSWVRDQLNIGADAAQKRSDEAKAKAKEEL